MPHGTEGSDTAAAAAVPERRNRPVRPRDAASVILLRGPRENPEVLLGRRRRSARFVPGVFVYPGGALDSADRHDAASLEVPDHLLRKLNRHCPAPTARGLVWAAIRETWEETGLLIARRDTACASSEASEATGTSPLHAALAERALCADASALEYVARAITPARNPIRFNTRFFLADATSLPGEIKRVSELEEIGWRAVSEAEKLDLMGVTRFALHEALRFWRGEGDTGPHRPIPRLAHRQGRRFIVME